MQGVPANSNLVLKIVFRIVQNKSGWKIYLVIYYVSGTHDHEVYNFYVKIFVVYITIVLWMEVWTSHLMTHVYYTEMLCKKQGVSLGEIRVITPEVFRSPS